MRSRGVNRNKESGNGNYNIITKKRSYEPGNILNTLQKGGEWLFCVVALQSAENNVKRVEPRMKYSG